jgi:hypothetical protein
MSENKTKRNIAIIGVGVIIGAICALYDTTTVIRSSIEVEPILEIMIKGGVSDSTWVYEFE